MWKISQFEFRLLSFSNINKIYLQRLRCCGFWMVFIWFSRPTYAIHIYSSGTGLIPACTRFMNSIVSSAYRQEWHMELILTAIYIYRYILTHIHTRKHIYIYIYTKVCIPDAVDWLEMCTKQHEILFSQLNWSHPSYNSPDSPFDISHECGLNWRSYVITVYLSSVAVMYLGYCSACLQGYSPFCTRPISLLLATVMPPCACALTVWRAILSLSKVHALDSIEILDMVAQRLLLWVVHLMLLRPAMVATFLNTFDMSSLTMGDVISFERWETSRGILS